MALNFPSNPSVGQKYYDSTSGFSYEWDGVVWQSFSPATVGQIRNLDDISSSFDGVVQVFNLTAGSTVLRIEKSNQVRIVLGGVVQQPDVDYVINTSSISFSTPPAPGLSFSGVLFGSAIGINTVSDGAITPEKLSAGGPYWDASGNVNITGILTAANVSASSSVTATTYYGDGSELTGITAAGLGTALSTDSENPLNKIYYTNQVLGVGQTITVDVPSSAQVAYTQYAEIQVTGDADLIVADGDDLITDILGIGTTGPGSGTLAGGGGKLRVDNILDKSGTGAPTFPGGVVVSAAATFTGNVSIAGTLTYDDVTNIDSVGLITARSGIIATGVVTATSFHGDGSALTGIDATALKDSGDVVRVQATTSGAIVTGVLTATSYSGVESWSQLDTWLYSP